MLSGSLFSLSARVQPKGELLAWGIFGAITVVGFLVSFGIRGAGLESAEFDENAEETDDEENRYYDEDSGAD